MRHRSHDVGLLDDADAADRPVRIALHNFDRVATATSRDGGGESAYAAANREYLQRFHDAPPCGSLAAICRDKE
ncbi:hypothetical protein PK98_09415 [Croceibacterium mercuriale]|uniref:Uncharacterized protein n=1 Tax=Croceibacterium mercuriale TaxID=1572751 RepID=A0A0B2C3G5_9SPHN|nr:hypothetical protein [Croceibacterium mercuriale]KHL26576.1 hypothetical protein PK98_09415 [Croceibacterium mercuriale]